MHAPNSYPKGAGEIMLHSTKKKVGVNHTQVGIGHGHQSAWYTSMAFYTFISICTGNNTGGSATLPRGVEFPNTGYDTASRDFGKQQTAGRTAKAKCIRKEAEWDVAWHRWPARDVFVSRKTSKKMKRTSALYSC
jgi:hypothetical protein